MSASAPQPELSHAYGTRIRYRVVAMAILLAMVTYLDRVCISTLADEIMADLSLSERQMSLVFSAFALAYAVFEIPTAWWADRAGTRRVLTRIVVWWSCFTMATAGAWNYASLLVTRFLFGMGEAGAWPSVARTFSQWIPRRERGTVQGIFFMGAHLSGGVTPLLVVGLMQWLPWRAIFVLFGLVGLVWAACWYRWFRDDPSQHPRVNARELEWIVSGREPGAPQAAGWDYWRRLLTSRNVLALCLLYFPNSYAFYFCITWFPKYLKEQHGLTTGILLAVLSGLPLALSVLADLFGGLTTDWVVAHFGPRAGRSLVGAGAYLVAGLFAFAAGLSGSPLVAAGLIAIVIAASMFTLGAAWGTCQDIGGNHAGVVSAAMNTSGQISTVLCPLVVIWLKDLFADWNAPLYLIGALFLGGAVAWCAVEPRRRVFDAPGAAT
jgi:MFS family permease